MRFELEFQEGVALGQLTYHLQPIVTCFSGRVEVLGAEALVRWERAGTTRAPKDFLPRVKDAGLLDDLFWCLLAQVRKSTLGIPVHLNISADQLTWPLVRRLERFQWRNGCLLGLEIIEDRRWETCRWEECADIIRYVQRLGVQVFIDDFGTGMSNLEALRHLPVTGIKVPRQFTANAGCQTVKTILSSIFQVARELNLIVISEGVETEEHLQNISALGGEVFQGYYFGRPSPLDKFLRFLSSTRKCVSRAS